MSGETRHGTLAVVNRAAIRSARLARDAGDDAEDLEEPSRAGNSPTARLPPPRCFLWTGSVIAPGGYTPAASGSVPDAARIRGMLSTPFCKLTTTASGARYGLSDRAASSVSVVFTQNKITSASRTADVSVEAFTATRS